MKSLIKTVSLSKIAFSIIGALAVSGAASANDSFTPGVVDALKDTKVNINFRGRYEGVDQDGIDKRADAFTVKSRFTAVTGAYEGFKFGIEVDNVTALVDNYNSTINGKTEYPVVADPEGTEVNQAFLKYSNSGFTFTGGRQRILHDNQRFVGGVGWRQNEQTYDGARFQYSGSGFTADYSYIHNINRIFSDKSAKGNHKGDFHLINGNYKFNKNHKVIAFAYLLDYDAAVTSSSSTFGATYNGKLGPVGLNASYAVQSDNGDNPNSYDANYYNIEASTKLNKFTVLAGYEVLGSDNGVGFSTPLATLHKFQGFADKFLSTPAEGVQDIYITGKVAISGVKLGLTYHDLSSDVDSIDYGSEIDFTAAYNFNKNYGVLLKFANYSSDKLATDTSKLWLQGVAKF